MVKHWSSLISVPSGISRICLVMVLSNREINGTEWRPLWKLHHECPSQQARSTPPHHATIKVFSAFAMWLHSKNYVLIIGTIDELISFSNYYCCFFNVYVFFFWKIPKVCLLLQCSWPSWGKVVLRIWVFHLLASHHILHKAGLENVNHLLQWAWILGGHLASSFN